MSDQKHKVAIAISGGVDSSVAAALVQRAGYQAVGVTLVFRPPEEDEYVSWC
jgi:tRNA-uridine 2-sulfurtransferase